MRSHAQIIEDAGRVPGLRQKLADEGFDIPDATVRSWLKRNGGAGSIPPEYWAAIAKLGLASLVELALAAERRRFPHRPPSLPLRAAA